MDRPRLILASLVPAGRHCCHPLGLLLAALLLVTSTQVASLLATGSMI